ncbi:hypothetical protein [Actibacterium pelagium]|uniref:Uncharacterized protein n=1 Tax=Actibacterium pelagium TaxID=2029103 RepID=A0A917EJ70_9RHOB|nr:hypothetical protein [Actibacterium pelagium]GGE42087.1 hypothetical protein GCM10011517_07150 [Actibacterium pelagium]
MLALKIPKNAGFLQHPVGKFYAVMNVNGQSGWLRQTGDKAL